MGEIRIYHYMGLNNPDLYEALSHLSSSTAPRARYRTYVAVTATIERRKKRCCCCCFNFRAMAGLLGLTRGFSGHGHHFKSPPQEPSVVEVSASDKSDALDDVEITDVPKETPFSPTLSAVNSLSIAKRPTSRMTMSRTFSSKFTSTFLREQHLLVRHRLEQHMHGIGHYAFDTSHEGLLKWIRDERMTRLPPKGGSWDRVLIAAHYFADQVERFNYEISDFTASSGSATNLVFGQCLVLLELGHKNASALETAFNALYQFGLELAPLLHRAELFKQSHNLMEEVGRAFAELLQIVTGISISFFQAVHSGQAFTKIDIFTAFSSLIEAFRHRVHVCSHAMWNVTLEYKGYEGCQAEDLQEWLAPKDSVLAFLSSNHIQLGNKADPFTCTWFQSELTSFLKSTEKIMLVEGKVGTGKTTLANWTVDRLHRPIARKHVSSISFSYNYGVITQSKPLDMLKTLLNQLLVLRIGDIDIFQAVYEAYMASETANTVEKQEASLWTALTKCIKDVSGEGDTTLVVVIDNVADSVRGAVKQLQDLVASCSQVRLVQFSQELNHRPAHYKKVTLGRDNSKDDIRTIVKRKLQQHDHFAGRQSDEKELMIEKLVEASEGSILWATLTCRLVQRQKDQKSFDEALASAHKGSKTVTEAVKKLLLDLNLTDDEERLLVMLGTVERPLRLSEVEALMRIERHSDNDAGTITMLNHIRAFTVFNEGLVTISHDAIRQAVFDFKADRTLTKALTTRQDDMVLRLLEYVKVHLIGTSDPTMSSFDLQQTRNRLLSSTLLEYAVRYWIVHFKHSSWGKKTGEITLSKELMKVFPSSVTLVILEQSCWGYQFFASETYDLLDLAYRIRRAQFGTKHNAVLQSALFLALFSERTPSKQEKAIEWYHVAAHLAKETLGVHADITIICCQSLLKISARLVTKENKYIFKYREEVLLILVSSYEFRYGSSSKEVLEIYYMLRELYTFYEEHKKLELLIITIGKLTGVGHDNIQVEIPRDGRVVLRPHGPIDVIDVRDHLLFGDYKEELREIITIEIIEREWKFISSLTIKLEIEEHLIALWLKLSDHCHGVHDCVWHEWKIKIALRYALFLFEEKRHTEASAILIAIWTEYERHEFLTFESIILLFKEIGLTLKRIYEVTKVISLLTVSLAVLKVCWSYFKRHHMHSSEHFILIEKEMAIISIIISKHVEKSTSVTIIREIFESYFESSTTVITTHVIEMCKSLVYFYMKSSSYTEAIIVIEKLISKSWSSFFSVSIESIVLTELFLSETVHLIIELGSCYEKTRRLDKAEEIYYRLYLVYYRHSKNTKLIEEYKNQLILFYQRHELFVKLISFYQELLVEYRKVSLVDIRTIKLLYRLGKICRLHSSKYGYWLEYYLEIIINLNKGRKDCHHDAFKALIIVAEHYYEELRYSEALIHFECIFETLFLHYEQYVKLEWLTKYFGNIAIIRLWIEHYSRCIEESKVSIDIHIAILIKLREFISVRFSSEKSLYVHISIMLAECYERHISQQFRAIEVYEHLLSHYKEIVTTTTITKITKSLQILYIKQIETETTVTKETLERSIIIIKERYIHIRKEYSHTHEFSVEVLRQLIMIYYKLSKFDLKYIDIALKEVRLLIVEIVKTAVSVSEMIQAAIVISSIYINCQWIEHAYMLIYELKRQIIYKIKDGKFDFDVIGSGRSCFTFIAAFEYYLRLKFTIAYYMRDLVAEYLFYERFLKYTETKNFEMLLVCGSRIRQLLVRTHRERDFVLIVNKTIDFVKRTETRIIKHSSESSVRVFIGVVFEYYASGHLWKSWTAGAAYAAVLKITKLLETGHHQEALELTTCTFHFLMAHEGLDDPTELTLGFKLALMMAGRGIKNYKPGQKKIAGDMMDLSRHILAEVFKICDAQKDFKLAECQLIELNELIILLGEQKDYKRLAKVLRELWTSRTAQSTWPPEVSIYLGKRLIQALFADGETGPAVELCETIAYNIRRVHGARHHQTLSFQALLASMYTTIADNYGKQAAHESTKNKKHAVEMRQLYLRKAVRVHEEALRLIVNSEDADASDGDDDDDNNYGHVLPSGQLANIFIWRGREQELQHTRIHVRRLQLALQRLGGPIDERHRRSIEALMNEVWKMYGHEKDFKLNKNQVTADHWKFDGYGDGKAEGSIEEDGYMEPRVWWVLRGNEPEPA